MSCKDEEGVTTINGTVINFGSRQPLAGARVTLTDGIEGGILFPDADTYSDRWSVVYTDSLGRFSISLKGEHQASFSVGMKDCTYDPNWNDGISVGVRGFPFGTHDDVLCELKAYAYFNPLLKNNPGEIQADSVKVSVLWYDDLNGGPFGVSVGIDDENLSNGTFRFMNIDKGWIVTGDLYLRYKVSAKRDQIWKSRIDSVFIKSFETFEGDVYY